MDENEESKQIKKYTKCIEIVKIISNNDERAIKEVEKSVNDTDSYYNDIKSEFERDRAIFDCNDQDTIIWIGMVNNLIRHGYACELDFKEELEEFKFSLCEIKNGNLIDFSDLDENDNIEIWCNKINKKIKKNNLGICDIDIDSDSYVLFICELDKIEKLKILAKDINHKINIVVPTTPKKTKKNKRKSIGKSSFILTIIALICMFLYIISQKQIKKSNNNSLKKYDVPDVNINISPDINYDINEIDENAVNEIFDIQKPLNF